MKELHAARDILLGFLLSFENELRQVRDCPEREELKLVVTGTCERLFKAEVFETLVEVHEAIHDIGNRIWRLKMKLFIQDRAVEVPRAGVEPARSRF